MKTTQLALAAAGAFASTFALQAPSYSPAPYIPQQAAAHPSRPSKKKSKKSWFSGGGFLYTPPPNERRRAKRRMQAEVRMANLRRPKHGKLSLKCKGLDLGSLPQSARIARLTLAG